MYTSFSDAQKAALGQAQKHINHLIENGGFGGLGDPARLRYVVGQLQATGLVPLGDNSACGDPDAVQMAECFSAPPAPEESDALAPRAHRGHHASTSPGGAGREHHVKKQKVHALLALLARVELNLAPPRRSPWEWFPPEGIHPSPAGCPLWYDGCWCTHHVRRGQKRKARGRHPLGTEALRFRWLRQQLNLTLQKTARRCHLTVAQVMGIEEGRLGHDAWGWQRLFDRLDPPF